MHRPSPFSIAELSMSTVALTRTLCTLLLSLAVAPMAVSAQPPATTSQAPAGDTLRAALARGYLLIDRLVSLCDFIDE